MIKAYDFLFSLFIHDMKASIAHLTVACLTVSIANQTIALCINARLSGDVRHLTLKKDLILTECYVI